MRGDIPGPAFTYGFKGGPILPVYGKIKRRTDIIENRADFIIPLNLRLRITYKIY